MRSGFADNGFTVTLGVRIPIEKAEKLRQMAQAEDRPTTTVARRLLAEAIERATAVPA